eukprot:128261_1
MTNVKINEINLCSLMLQQIVKDLKNKPMHSKLKKIEINASREDSDISVKQAIHEYAAKFRKIDVFVYKELAWNRLCIDLSTPEELALYLLENMEKKNIYIHDPNAEMTMIIEKALTVKDSKIYNYCSGKPKLEIDCKNMNENKGSDLFNEFYQPQNEWIKLKKLNSIFPGIGAICVKHTTLTATILEDILKHFRTNKKTILKEIKICNLHKSGLNISQAITQYKKQFDEINFDIKEDIDKNNANVENDVDEDDNYMNKTCLLIKRRSNQNGDEQSRNNDLPPPTFEAGGSPDLDVNEANEEEKLSEEVNENNESKTESRQIEDILTSLMKGMDELQSMVGEVRKDVLKLNNEQQKIKNMLLEQQEEQKTLVTQYEINNSKTDVSANIKKVPTEFENTANDGKDKYQQFDDRYYELRKQNETFVERNANIDNYHCIIFFIWFQIILYYTYIFYYE